MNAAELEALLEAIAVTAELTGTTFSQGAARVFAEDLMRYPSQAVMTALHRCRREVRGRLVLADVILRMEDGRPGVEEAWSLVPHSESDSVVWCQEMANAYGVCLPLLETGDTVGARMAFKEAYTAELLKARSDGVPAKFWVSNGTDKAGRVKALQVAAERNRISRSGAAAMIEYEQPSASARALGGPQSIAGVLEHFVENVSPPPEARALLAELRRQLAGDDKGASA